MKPCSKLFKEALEGIDFRYKLDDVLTDTNPNQKFSKDQLNGYLLKKGVSPKEIKQSGLFDNAPTKPITIEEWIKQNPSSHKITESQVKSPDYADVTLNPIQANVDESAYREQLAFIKKPRNSAPQESHFAGETDRFNEADEKSLLGWRRLHDEEINGKRTTVLNEFQSDWAQTERAGRGVFNSNVIGLKELDQLKKRDKEINQILNDKWKKANQGFDEFQKANIDLYKEAESIQANIKKAETLDSIVADFPMSENKFHQYQIVAALDEAIKTGTNRVAIPIDRSGALLGSEGVTKFYDSLNKKILPEIRKKLEKQGMKIKVSKEDYAGPGGQFDFIDDYTAGDRNDFFNSLLEDWEYLNLNNIDGYPFKESFDEIVSSLRTGGQDPATGKAYNSVDVFVKMKKWLKQANSSTNTLHVLEVEEIPNKKVRWDVYSILSGIGLAEVADKLKEEEKL